MLFSWSGFVDEVKLVFCFSPEKITRAMRPLQFVVGPRLETLWTSGSASIDTAEWWQSVLTLSTDHLG